MIRKVELIREIGLLKSRLALLNEANEELHNRLGIRVPRRDYDALCKSVSVCHGTIERLMTTLYKLDPQSAEVSDARDILAYVETLLDSRPDMQDEVYVKEMEKRASKVRSAHLKRAGRMLRTKEVPVGPNEKPVYFGTTKREYKP